MPAIDYLLPEAVLDWLDQAEAHYQRSRRPLVGVCYAQSLDGCISAAAGRPTALSGAEAGRVTHALRAAHDAILVGIGTVLSDDPQLTVRRVPGRSPQPVIVDSRLRTPPEAFLVERHPTPAWIFAACAADPARGEALEAAGARVWLLPDAPGGQVDLAALLQRLGQAGVRSLMVEGGAQVITSFLEQRLADWVSVTLAPRFLGGLHALQRPLASAPELQEVCWQPAGADLLAWGRLPR